VRERERRREERRREREKERERKRNSVPLDAFDPHEELGRPFVEAVFTAAEPESDDASLPNLFFFVVSELASLREVWEESFSEIEMANVRFQKNEFGEHRFWEPTIRCC
jgi:hypothetical protein